MDLTSSCACTNMNAHMAVSKKVAGKLLFLLPIASLAYLGLFFSNYGSQGYYQSGFDFTLKADGYHVQKVVPETPAERSGLQEGMLILKVNGVDAVNLNMISETDLGAFLAISSGFFIPGKTVSLEDETGTLYSIPLDSLPWAQRFALLEFEVINGIIVGIVFILTGIWLLAIGKDDTTIRWFLGFTASAGIALASSFFSSYWSNSLLATRFIVLDASTVAAVIFLTGFVKRFPSSTPRKLSRLVWIPLVAIITKYLLVGLGILDFYGPAIYLVHTVLGVSLVYIVILLARRYKEATAGGRRRLHWVIAGITLSLVPYIFYVFSLILQSNVLSGSMAVFSNIANFSIMWFPILVGIGVLKYNLFDIDRFLNRFAVLFFMAIAFTLLYSLVFMLFFESRLTLELYLVLLLTALLSPAVYLKLDSVITALLKRGYKDRRQILLEMEQELIGVYRTSDVYPIVSTALVFAFDPSTIQFVKTAGGIRELEFTYPPFQQLSEGKLEGGMVLPLIQKGDSRIVLGVGRKRDEDIFTKDDAHLLTSAAAQISKALENCELYRQLEESLANESDAQRTAILSLAKLTEYRDQETGRHLERIQDYTRLLALKLKDDKIDAEYLNEEYINALCLSSILHDIGKVGIPDHILLKPGKLTEEEFTIIKRHTLIGGKVLEDAENIKPDRTHSALLVTRYHCQPES